MAKVRKPGKPLFQPTQLRAKQIMTFQHPEGGEGLMMVDMEGKIYLRGENGWKAFDMTEENEHDSTV